MLTFPSNTTVNIESETSRLKKNSNYSIVHSMVIA